MAVIAQQSRSATSRYPQKSSVAPTKSSSNRGSTGPSPERRDGSNEKLQPAASPNPVARPQPGQSSQANRSAPAAACRPAYRGKPAARDAAGGPAQPEPEIIFQKYFKSVGPRTYAAQMKRARNGNHFLVLTESKRDEKTNEPRKTRLYLYSEDFVAFFRMLHETAQFIRDNPVPEAIRKRQERKWSKASNGSKPVSAAR